MQNPPAVERSPKFNSPEEIDQLVTGFQTGTWPLVKWTHVAHLTVALWHLRRYPPDEASRLIRDGIQKYNKSQGVPLTPTRGYHESLTLFWIWAVTKFLEQAGADNSLLQLSNALMDGPYGNKSLPFEYYSRERLMSWEARTTWVAPDLRPLD